MISTGENIVSISILQLHHALELLVSNKLAKTIELEMHIKYRCNSLIFKEHLM